MIIGPLQALDVVVELELHDGFPSTMVSAFSDMRCEQRADVCIDADGADPDFAMQSALMRVNALVVERSEYPILLHACAVQTPIGAVVFAGASRAGKTSLATAVATLGHRFLADEIVAIDESDCRRYGKPIALRDEAAAALAARLPPGPRGARWLAPSSIGAGDDRVPLAALIFPRFDPAATTHATALSQAETLERLTASVLGAHRVNIATFRHLETLARGVYGHEVVFPSVIEAADTTLAVLSL